MKRRVLTIPVALCLLATLAGAASGGRVLITGVAPTLTISTATAGQDPDPVVNEACGLRYGKDVGDPTMKITVRTNNSGPSFVLQVEAFNEAHGNPTGTVNLSTTAQDLITDITSIPNRTCSLRYRAVPTAADGTGADGHIVTYTVVAQ